MINNYCERVTPDFWSEPVNAVTNLAFFVTALGLYRLLRAESVREPLAWILVLLILAIGIGSFLFHTFATRWAGIMDVVPILLFQLTYLWAYVRRIIGFGAAQAILAVTALIVGIALSGQFSHLANGSLAYAPAAIALGLLAVFHWRCAETRWTLPLATALFVVSITMRSVDQVLCSVFPLGTHFAWHLLNAVVLFLCVYGLTKNLPKRG